ncbi:hypothetical protein QTJ16_004303 [Diplocarpon rosae]|uniref:Uncharacterized protein n=1 Tax=Diplocarpon rosae TaxID=946125 RepID=A0AAD9WE95_9HELO|nr:hypothetical protein QTJ16_004303 [Diplocarpon rosae]PBP21522.1 hypothetical protein BUE80_DR007400 [Diplocarpon rosae]
MPRPKRTKVAPSAPAPRVRKPTKTAPPIASTPAITKAPFNDLYDVSDNGEEIIESARHARKSKVEGKAVARSLREAALHSRDSDSKEGGHEEYRREVGQRASEEPVEESLLPEIDLESSSPAMEAGRKDRYTSACEKSMVAIGNFKRRPRQPSILGRGTGRARSSSLDSNMAEGTGLVSVGKKTTSTMVMSNYKREPKERSMRQNARSVAPSSMALEMEEEAVARDGSAKDSSLNRRERERSVLRTVQKVRQDQPLDYDDDDEDFNPEDESTPLNLSKTRDLASSSAASSANSRKRKLSTVQAPRSSPPLISPKDVEADEAIPATYPSSYEQERENAEPSPEPIRLSIEARSETPEVLSETMAPPQSSSSIPPSPELPSRVQRAPSRGRRSLRGRTPPPRTQDSPISSPPSLTHSPNRPVHVFAAPSRKAQRIAPPPSTFSTAQLQALLPRRRTRNAARDPFDIPSSEDEVDVSGLAPGDDELSHLNVHARARRQASVRARTPAPVKKGAKVNKLTPKQKDSTVTRTYGAARAVAISDKENDAGVGDELDPDDSLAPIPDDEENGNSENSQELEQRVGKELKQAAKKFQEVDKWELEFEDITASSSPPDAR